MTKIWLGIAVVVIGVGFVIAVMVASDSSTQEVVADRRQAAAPDDLKSRIEQMEKLVAADQRFALELANLYAAQGDESKIRSICESALAHFRIKVGASPNSLEDRIHWARLAKFLEQFDEAVTILTDGARRLGLDVEAEQSDRSAGARALDPSTESSLGPQHEQIRRELGVVYLSWHRYVKHTDPQNAERQLQLLLRAFRLAPDHPVVLEQLARLATSDAWQSARAREILQQVLSQGTATPLVHYILGMSELERGNPEQAEHHLRLAIAKEPKFVEAANNLAWMLAEGKSPRLEEAERLIEMAVELAPQHPEIRETRGQIWAKAGKIQGAIVDLKFALARLGNRAKIHTTLAALYEQLGNQDLAKLHRDFAKLYPARAIEQRSETE